MNCNTTHYRANSSSVPGDPTDSYIYVDVGSDEPLIVRENGTALHQAGDVLSVGLIEGEKLHKFDAGGKPFGA